MSEATSDDRSVDELLAGAYALDGSDASRALYAQWAATYESGFVASSGYVYHEHVAECFLAGSALAGDDVVIDIGCGTGIGGEALRRRGVVTVDGLDLSPEMLALAAAKRVDGSPVYRNLIEADVTHQLEIATGTYAGVVSVGTFTHGHVGPSALAEVIRIVRPGGRGALGVNAGHFAATGFGDAFEQLVADGRIADFELIDMPIYADADLSVPDRFAHIAVFTVR